MRRLPNRAWMGSLAAMTAAGVAVHFAISALGVSGPAPASAPRTEVLASIDLADDDGGRALFPSTVLVPAKPVSRCLEVRYSGTRHAQSPGVRFAARDVAGALVPRLGVTVEVGTGGGFAGCAGFRGHSVFSGRLASLGSPTGIGTGWTPSPGETRTYRITVTLDRGTATGRAAARFEWTVTSVDATRSPSPTPSRTAVPAPVVSAQPSRATHPSSGPSSSPKPAGTSPNRLTVCLPPPDPDWADRVGATIGDGLRALVTMARLSGPDSPFLLVLLLLLLLFLLLHRLIDRRDPKLALAPLVHNRYAYLPAEGELRYLPARAAGTLRRAVPPPDNGHENETHGGAHGNA